MKFEPGQQLYVNNKWFFDILESKDGTLECRIKYKEAPNRQFYLYKTIKLSESLITIVESNDLFISARVDEKRLKEQFGSLIDRIIKEQNPYLYKVNEEASADAGNTGGIGDVSQPSLSGIAGVPGSAGSGDINIGKKKQKQLIYTIPQQKSKIKSLLMDIIGLKEDLSNDEPETDTDYKKNIYEFLDYPWTIDVEIDLATEASKNRDYFIDASVARISAYFKDLYNVNKYIIDNKCSSNFVNKFLMLAKV